MKKRYVMRKGKPLEVWIDEEDKDLFDQNKWHITTKGYLRTYARGLNLYFHRIVMECPEGLVIDHINGNPLDNRKDNLRICTYAENMMNRRKLKPTSSKYKGVEKVNRTKGKFKYRAVIQYQKERFHLGYFKEEDEAAIAYNEQAKVFFGEFAYLNDVPPKTEKTE